MSYIKPEVPKLLQMLEMVAGASANAKVADGLDEANISHTAVYVGEGDEAVATCTCDMGAAAALGCSLSLIPPAGAEDMVSSGKLSDNAADNLYEVMNIFSSLMMDDKSSHLKLVSVKDGADDAITGKTVENVSFLLNLGAYGEGTISFNAV